MKTVEELEAELKELKESLVAVSGKKDELLDELKKERRKHQDSIDMEKYQDLEDKFSALESDYKKLQKESAVNVDKLQTQLNLKTDSLNNLLIDGGLTDSLLKAGVKAEFMDATKALLRGQAKLVESESGIQAMMGDKSISEFIDGWAKEQGKHFISANDNSGSGSGGNSGQGGNHDFRKYFDKASPDFNLTKQAEIMKTNPELYNQLKTA